ncbi:DUF2339 domain-containing protein, partial [Mycolicibacterium vaccae]
MTEPHSVALSRLSAELAAISGRLAQVSADLQRLDATPYWQPVAPPAGHYWPQPPALPRPAVSGSQPQPQPQP